MHKPLLNPWWKWDPLSPVFWVLSSVLEPLLAILQRNVFNSASEMKWNNGVKVQIVHITEKVKNSARKKLLADCWSSVGRLSANSWSTVCQQLAHCCLPPFTRIFCQQSADSWPFVGRLSADCWQHVGNLLATCWLKTPVEYHAKF